MAREIERKFLVTGDSWRAGATTIPMRQGYLCRDPGRTVRVRLAGDDAWLTIKARSTGITRSEFEYRIPPAEATELLALCLPGVVAKTRHRVRHDGMIWEVDEFHGENHGLIVAEIELPDAGRAVNLPSWAGREVSHLPRYFNARLADHPFNAWTAGERAGE